MRKQSYMHFYFFRLRCCWFTFSSGYFKQRQFIFLVCLNSSCFFLPSSSFCLTVHATSSPMTSFVPNWINSFESSTVKGFPSCPISFDRLSTCFPNVSWKAGESSWWLYFQCSFPLRTVKSSNLKQPLPLLGCNFANAETCLRLQSNQQSLCHLNKTEKE